MNLARLAGETVAADDVTLMRQVAAGRVEAFEELCDRYETRAHRVAWSICRDRDRAEDAVQDAFLSIWRSRASYIATHGTVAAWLLSVVRYASIDVARRNGKHAARRADEEHMQLHPGPGDLADIAVSRSEAGHLRSLLGQLPDAQREVITLAFYGELTHLEIAQLLDTPSGTVKGRMRLGMDKLRRELAQVKS